MAAATFLMSTWNAGPWIRPAIESVLAQTEPDWRMVVVDDCSSDGTPDVVESYEDDRISVVRAEVNAGQTAALNRGLELIETPWVARLDQDDLAAPQRLERQLAFVGEHPGTVGVGAWASLIDEDDNLLEVFRPPTEPAAVKRDFYARPEANPIAHSSMLFDAALARELGGYPSQLAIAQDYGLWVQLAARGEVANVPDVLTSIRQHGGQASGSRKGLVRQLREMIEVSSGLADLFGLEGEERRAWNRARLRLVAHRAVANGNGKDWPALGRDTRELVAEGVRDPAVFADTGRVLMNGVRHRVRSVRGAEG